MQNCRPATARLTVQQTVNTCQHLSVEVAEDWAQRHVAVLEAASKREVPPANRPSEGRDATVTRLRALPGGIGRGPKEKKPVRGRASLWSGWPDLNRRPLDPQNG